MINRKQLIPTVAAVFVLAGCGASAAASAANGTGEVKSEGFFDGSTPNETSVLVSFTK